MPPRKDRAIGADEVEAEALTALRKAYGKGEAPEVILKRLEKAGYEVTRNRAPKPDEDGVHVYYGFPFRWSENYSHQLRSLSDMIDKGEAEVINMMVIFNYYHVAENEDGYEIRKGLIRSLSPEV